MMGAPTEQGHGQEVCLCGEDDCLHFAVDYPWCRPCEEHHRPPECPVDEQGRSLAPCGHPWDDEGLCCGPPAIAREA